jgi:hypothetical protein
MLRGNNRPAHVYCLSPTSSEDQMLMWIAIALQREPIGFSPRNNSWSATASVLVEQGRTYQ